jgi:thioredoxin 2
MGDFQHIVCPHCHSTNRLPVERVATDALCGRCKQKLFIAKPVALTSLNFKQHIQKNDIPVVVDFWAPWCGPCKMMAPVFEQAAQQMEPKVRFVKINTEEEQGLASTYNIRSIPTIALFKNGQEATRVAGAMDLHNLIGWIRQSL